MFGNPETTPGGRAKFYSSVRLDVRKIENLKDGTDVVGSRTRVKVVKNKVAAVPPVRVRHHVWRRHLQGGSLLDVGVDLEIVKKSGAWFTYEGDQLGQGRENARQFLAEHTDIAIELERRVREAVGLTAFGAEGDETPIEVVPDLVEIDEPAPKAAKAESVRRRGHERVREGPLAPSSSHGDQRTVKRPLNRHERALRLLAVRPRARRELESRLRQAGFEDGRGVVGARPTRGGRAARRRGLRARVRRTPPDCPWERATGGSRSARSQGVSRETIDQTLAGLEEDESGRALEVATERARRLTSLRPEAAYGRLVAFLARRGYDDSVSREAARAAWRSATGTPERPGRRREATTLASAERTP